MIIISKFFDELFSFISEKAANFISTIIIFMATFALIFLIKAIVKRYIKRNRKKKHAITLAKLILSILKYFLIIIAIIIVLDIWGVNVKPILAGAGIITLAISFGAQNLIADLINGMCIVFEDYYSVDDVIEIDGFKGTVTEITMKSTKITNWKNQVKVINNGEIKNVINYSRGPSIGVVEIDIAYKEDIERVISLLEEKLVIIKEQFGQVVEGPNVIGVSELSNSSVRIRITVTTTSEKHYSVERAIKKYVKIWFDEAGIEIPFPQLVVHNKNDK